MAMSINEVFGSVTFSLNDRGDEVESEICNRCSSPGGGCVCRQDVCPDCGERVGECTCPVEPTARDATMDRIRQAEEDFNAEGAERRPVERRHGGRPRSERVSEEVVKLAKDLAAQIIGAQPGSTEVTPKMRSLAAGIAGLTGVSPAKDVRSGRVFIDDLVVGELYIAHGWGGNEFEWTYLGMGSDSDDHLMIRRTGKDPTSEALGDHGLGAYASGTSGALWHPTNWTEALGIKENAAASVANAIAHEAGMSNVETFGDFGGGNDIS